MGEWQPIETAPRDGTRILLFCPPDHMGVNAWFTFPEPDTDTGEDMSGFYECAECFDAATTRATHWMPLPPRPMPARPPEDA